MLVLDLQMPFLLWCSEIIESLCVRLCVFNRKCSEKTSEVVSPSNIKDEMLIIKYEIFTCRGQGAFKVH